MYPKFQGNPTERDCAMLRVHGSLHLLLCSCRSIYKNLTIYKLSNAEQVSAILDQLAQFPNLETVNFNLAGGGSSAVSRELMSDEIKAKILNLTHLKEIRYR